MSAPGDPATVRLDSGDTLGVEIRGMTQGPGVQRWSVEHPWYYEVVLPGDLPDEVTYCLRVEGVLVPTTPPWLGDEK